MADLGCGANYGMVLRRLFGGYLVGLDLDEKLLKTAKSLAMHDEHILADIRSLPFRNKSFDAITAFEVLEHLKAEEAVLALLEFENIAVEKVIVSTPNALGPYVEELIEKFKIGSANDPRKHRSVFTTSFFTTRGYSVNGSDGFRQLRHLFLRKRASKLLRSISAALQTITQPIVFYFPNAAHGLLCIRDIRDHS